MNKVAEYFGTVRSKREKSTITIAILEKLIIE
jgi:hypothetical protein